LSFVHPMLSLIYSFSVSVWSLVLIAFGLIPASSSWNLSVALGYSWNSSQTAFGIGVGLFLLICKDLLSLMRGRNHNRLCHLSGAIHVRCIALDQEEKEVAEIASPTNPVPTLVLRPERRAGGGMLEVSKMRARYGELEPQTLAVSEQATFVQQAPVATYVDCIVLRESQTLVVVLLGKTFGKWCLMIVGNPKIRLLLATMKAIPLTLFNAVVLTGILPPYASVIVLVGVIPIGVSFLIKSPILIKLVLFRVETVSDILAFIFGLTLMGVVLADARCLAFVFIVMQYLDLQTRDARACFFTSSTWLNKYPKPGMMLRTLLSIMNLLVLLSILALPFCFSFGLVANANTVSSIQLTPTSPQFTLYNLVCSFLFAFCVKLVMNSLEDVRYRRLKASQVFLTSFNAKIEPKYVAFAQKLQQGEPDPISDPPSDIDPSRPMLSIVEPTMSRIGGGRREMSKLSSANHS